MVTNREPAGRAGVSYAPPQRAFAGGGSVREPTRREAGRAAGFPGAAPSPARTARPRGRARAAPPRDAARLAAAPRAAQLQRGLERLPRRGADVRAPALSRARVALPEQLSSALVRPRGPREPGRSRSHPRRTRALAARVAGRGRAARLARVARDGRGEARRLRRARLRGG